jgi:NAD-dependent dihydropyrimidine dehydrogenase PreA subunit
VNCITVYEAWVDIDQDTCTDCGSCVSVCPVGAMSVDKARA